MCCERGLFSLADGRPLSHSLAKKVGLGLLRIVFSAICDSVRLMSPEFSRAEGECEAKFLPLVIKALPPVFIKIMELKESDPSFGLPLVLFELAKRLRIFTTKGGITLVESMETVKTGMNNSQLMQDVGRDPGVYYFLWPQGQAHGTRKGQQHMEVEPVSVLRGLW